MKKSIYLLIAFLIFNFQFLIAQKQGQARLDSLLQELPKAKEDTNKVNLLNSLSSGYYSINPNEGIKYGEIEIKAIGRFKTYFLVNKELTNSSFYL